MDPSEPVSGGRADELITLAVSAVAATLVTAISSVSPTGSAGPDAIVTFLLAWLVIWVGSAAPWWALVGAGSVAVVGSGSSGWIVAAVVAVAGGVWIAVPGVAMPCVALLRVLTVAAAVLALFHVTIDPFLGCSAIIASAAMVFVAGSGLACCDRSVRRRVLWSLAATCVLTLLAVVGLGAAALQARANLQRGSDRLQDGFDQLRAGDTSAAAQTLRAAAADLDAAGEDIDGFWEQPARLLPVVAQHRDLAVSIVATGASSAAAAADALSSVDLDQLRLVGGSLDIATLGTLAEPLSRLDAAVRDLAGMLDASHSPWLVGAVRKELEMGRDEIDGALVQTAASAAVAASGPAVLGVDAPRRYLVVFTVPGSARALSGAITDYAEIEITDGTIEQTAFGRIEDLIVATDPDFWSTVTTEPDMPTAAAAMAAEYADGGHGAVDGVIMMDAFGIAALVEASGPITLTPDSLPELAEGVTIPEQFAPFVSGQPITADVLRQFLLIDQYALPDEQRLAIVEGAAGAALRQFLGADLPDIQQLADALGPAATEGHITWWASRAAEQEAFRLVGMAGRLPSPAGSDGLAVVSNNAGDNYVDAFLQRTVAYTATYDDSNGGVLGDLTVTLRNGAPSDGLVSATNTMSFSVYSPLAATGVALDGRAVAGEDVTTTSANEAGEWNVTTIEVAILPGQTRTVTVQLDGAIDAGSYSLLWRPQTMTSVDALQIAVRHADGGGTIVERSEPLTRTSTLDADGVEAVR